MPPRDITWTHKFSRTLRSIVSQIPARVREIPHETSTPERLEEFDCIGVRAFSIKSVYQEIRTTEEIERLNQTMPFDSYVFPLTLFAARLLIISYTYTLFPKRTNDCCAVNARL